MAIYKANYKNMITWKIILLFSLIDNGTKFKNLLETVTKIMGKWKRLLKKK